VTNSAQLTSYSGLAMLSAQSAPRIQNDTLMHNLGGNGFAAMAFPRPFLSQPAYQTGVSATADYDGDGQPDVIESVGFPARLRLLHNDASGNHWLDVRLVGHESNRDGLGAKVTLKQASRSDVSQLVQRTRGSVGASWST